MKQHRYSAKRKPVSLECYAYKDVFQNWRRNKGFFRQKPKELTVNWSVLQEKLKQII